MNYYSEKETIIFELIFLRIKEENDISITLWSLSMGLTSLLFHQIISCSMKSKHIKKNYYCFKFAR